MPDTFEALRPALETYLRERGLDPRKRFRCLNPDHYDHDPSMGYDPKRHKVHCFACGADYDLFDLLTLDNGYTSPLEALAEASGGTAGETCRLPPPRGPQPERVSFSHSKQPQTSSERIPMNENHAAYITACAAKAGETPYFAQRGPVHRHRLPVPPGLRPGAGLRGAALRRRPHGPPQRGGETVSQRKRRPLAPVSGGAAVRDRAGVRGGGGV